MINKKIIEPNCFAAPPPWQVKSKKLAWRRGYDSGRAEGYKEAKQELKQQQDALQEQATNARVQMLHSIATITDAASRALLSYDKNL